MASKKQNSSKSAKNAGSKAAKKTGGKSKGRAVQVRQPKPWGLILAFAGVGVVALGLIGAAVFVVWDRSQPPEGVTHFYGDYANYREAADAVDSGEVTIEDLE